VLTDRYCLKVNRMPVWLQGRDLGAVVTIRDRTEHVELLRELDSVATLTDALRGQQHEHANRMHTVAGLLELDRPTEAASYLEQVAGDAAGVAEELKDRIGNATIVARARPGSGAPSRHQAGGDVRLLDGLPTTFEARLPACIGASQ